MTDDATFHKVANVRKLKIISLAAQYEVNNYKGPLLSPEVLSSTEVVYF